MWIMLSGYWNFKLHTDTQEKIRSIFFSVKVRLNTNININANIIFMFSDVVQNMIVTKI